MLGHHQGCLHCKSNVNFACTLLLCKWIWSWICNFLLLFCCSNIVVFSVRIFWNSVFGQECIFRCCAIELVSDRCIVSHLDRVVEVKQHYILLFSEIQSPKVHLNWYTMLVFLQNSNRVGEELLLITKLEALNLL